MVLPEGREQPDETTALTLRELLNDLGEVEWYNWHADDLEKKARAAGNPNIANSTAAHYRIQSVVESSKGNAKANELHSKPGVKLFNTVCLARGRSFSVATVSELCAALALEHRKTIDDLMPLDAEIVAAELAGINPSETPERQDGPTDESIPSAPSGFTKLDEYPNSPDGNMGYLEFARDDVNWAAGMKHHQYQEKYTDATIRAAVHLDIWEEAKRRFDLLLPFVRGEAANEVERIFKYPLSDRTVKKIDRSFDPAVDALRDAFQRGKSLTPIIGPEDLAIEPNQDQTKKRRCYDRDHLWLKWQREGIGIAAIRDRWNQENPSARIETGEAGRDLVKKGIKRAESEQKATGEN